jgi:hypothetical protein
MVDVRIAYWSYNPKDEPAGRYRRGNSCLSDYRLLKNDFMGKFKGPAKISRNI